MAVSVEDIDLLEEARKVLTRLGAPHGVANPLEDFIEHLRAEPRIVDLDQVGDNYGDDAVVTLRMLVEMHGESHRRWRITPSAGGSWNYDKVQT